MSNIALDELLLPLTKVTKDMRAAVRSAGINEIRYLVDYYYGLQELRKASDNQTRAAVKAGEPSAFVSWLGHNTHTLERNIASLFNAWTDADQLASRAKNVLGIDSIIAAGLAAHIDISKVETAGAVWRFAGLDPTLTWGKKQKRPFNARLKVLCFKIGHSFMLTHNKEDSFYGKVYRQRKQLEVERNDRLEFKDQAAAKLKKYDIDKSTDAFKHYSGGKLPPAHLEARAKRYATKLFLAHYFWVGYELLHGEAPPKPYIVAHGDHANIIGPPPEWYIDANLAETA